MQDNNKPTFDEFMVKFTNEKRPFIFDLYGLKLYFFHKGDTPVLMIDDSFEQREYVFYSEYSICRLKFNNILFSEIFKELKMV